MKASPPLPASVIPLPDRALFQLTGEDRVRFLNGQVTADLAKLLPGHSTPAATLTGKGKIVSDLQISATADALWIDAPQVRGKAVQERLEKFLIADDAELTEVTGAWELRHELNAKPVPVATPGMSFISHRYGVAGHDQWSPRGQGTVDPARLVTLEQLTRWRIERLLPEWGREIDENTLPQEILLERSGLSYDKGCYTGQETVARIRSIGHVNRWLIYLEAIEVKSPLAPAPLEFEGQKVGQLTTALPDCALAMVQRKATAVGVLLHSPSGVWRVATPPGGGA
jgi:tRNA-modifying protein YgfZ